MSWDVTLSQDSSICQVESHEEGGTHVLGGTTEASLNVTYNYGQIYRLVWGCNLAMKLDGSKASLAIPALQEAVEKLGTRQHDDYWAPTPGNAGHALNILLGWAKQYPDAIFEVN